MKDATGELSMTAVAVVAIAAIAALFSTLIWPTIKQNIMRSTYCSSAFNCDCGRGETSTGMCECEYCPSEAGAELDTTCASRATIFCSQNDVN